MTKRHTQKRRTHNARWCLALDTSLESRRPGRNTVQASEEPFVSLLQKLAQVR